MVEVVVADKVAVTVDSFVVAVVGGDAVVVVVVLVDVVVVLVVVVVVVVTVDSLQSGVSAGGVDKPDSKLNSGSSKASSQLSCTDAVEIFASNASWTVPDEGA